MRWGVLEWTECNTGGGEEIKGYEDGGPPTLCHLQASREAKRRWKPGRWSLEGLEECWGFGGKFLFSLFTFTQEVCFQSLVSQGLAGPAQVPVFGRVEWEEMFGWKWKFCLLCLFLLYFIVSAWYGLGTKVLANKCWEKYFQASGCSKELLDSLLKSSPQSQLKFFPLTSLTCSASRKWAV